MAENRLRVGTLDDPIWSEQPETQSAGSNERRHTSRIIALVLGLVLVLGLGLLGYWLVQPDHPGGDPGGSIMQSLKQSLQSVLPPGAHVTRVSYQEPHWTEACGWNVVFATVSFTSDQSREEIVGHATSVLTAVGWSRDPGTGGGPDTWSHQVAHGSVKRIDLATTSTVPTDFYSLTAAAPPQGGETDCSP
jgi:hypothetical protein